MNNEELKKKIVEVISQKQTYGIKEEFKTEDLGHGGWQAWTETTKVNNAEIADALIAAEIGDVKEAEAEANRYEMLYKMQSRDMALLERKVHEAEHRAKVLGRTLAIMKGKGLISGVVDDYIVQAEKELAEERKDG